MKDKPCDEALDRIAHVVGDAFQGDISDAEAVGEIEDILEAVSDQPPSVGEPPPRAVIDRLVAGRRAAAPRTAAAPRRARNDKSAPGRSRGR